MRTAINLTRGVLLLSLFPLACLSSNLRIRVFPSSDVYFLGDPVPIVVEVRNEGRERQSFDESNLSLQLVRQDDGRLLPRIGPMGPSGTHIISPNGVLRIEWNVNNLFHIEAADRYAITALYKVHVTEVSVHNGVESAVTREIAEARSDQAVFTVMPLDQQLIDRFVRLLRSDKVEDIQDVLTLLSTARAGVYRKVVPSLWSVIRTHQPPIKNRAFELFLNRIDLADDRVSDDELFAELAIAATDEAPSVRLTAAESLCRLHAMGVRRQSLNRFVAQKVPKWFDGETSPACRAFLVRRLPAPTSDRLVTIVQEDADPQVRVAALQRLVELDPVRFLESVEAFTNLIGQVSVEGQSLDLGAFVEGEKDRIRRTLQPDEYRRSTLSPK